MTILEGKCLSYSRGVPYHPVIDILKSNFNIQEGDEDYRIREKVSRGLKIIRADEASTLPYLLELLSVKDSGIDEISMSREDKKLRFMEALRRITLKGSEIRPVIMAVEDLHCEGEGHGILPGYRILCVNTKTPRSHHPSGRTPPTPRRR